MFNVFHFFIFDNLYKGNTIEIDIGNTIYINLLK